MNVVAWLGGRQSPRVAPQQAIVSFAEQDLDADRGANAGVAAVRGQRAVRPEKLRAELENGITRDAGDYNPMRVMRKRQ